MDQPGGIFFLPDFGLAPARAEPAEARQNHDHRNQFPGNDTVRLVDPAENSPTACRLGYSRLDSLCAPADALLAERPVRHACRCCIGEQARATGSKAGRSAARMVCRAKLDFGLSRTVL